MRISLKSHSLNYPRMLITHSLLILGTASSEVRLLYHAISRTRNSKRQNRPSFAYTRTYVRRVLRIHRSLIYMPLTCLSVYVCACVSMCVCTCIVYCECLVYRDPVRKIIPCMHTHLCTYSPVRVRVSVCVYTIKRNTILILCAPKCIPSKVAPRATISDIDCVHRSR